MNITEAQYQKLPRYAQQELDILTMNVDNLKKRISEFEGPADSLIVLRGYGNDHPLPKGDTVRFAVEDGTIDVRLEKDHLYVNSSRRLTIRPIATNCADMYCEDFFLGK